MLFLGVVAGLDQATKVLVAQRMGLGDVVEVVPGLFNIMLVYNKGAAFGMLANFSEGTRQVLLAMTTLVALSAVIYFLVREYKDDRLARLGISFIMGGALGNIIDRVRLGHVIDFLDFYYRSYHWPAFNVADSFICVGVVILLLRAPKRKDNEASPA